MGTSSPLLRKIDCVELAVPDLDAAIRFYCQGLGHTLKWRSGDSAGLRLPESDSELVLQTERPEPSVDWLVDSADEAARQFTAAGGSLVVPPFDIPVGRACVVGDPWGNRLVLLDLSKGTYTTDAQGNVTGVSK